MRETIDRAGVGEQPLPVSEGMGVLGSQVADGRRAHVSDEDVCAQIARQRCDIDFGALVDRAAPKEHLARLVKPNAPPERSSFCEDLERFTLELEDLPPEIRAVAHVAEESSHPCHSSL